MPENHTGDNLEQELASTLQEWGLDETRQTSITTDSGSNKGWHVPYLKGRG